MKKEDLEKFILTLDLEELKDYFYYHSRKETALHFGISQGNLDVILHRFNISVPHEIRSAKRKATNQKKYHVDNVFQAKFVKDQCKATKLDRYDDPYYNNHEQAVETGIARYGSPTNAAKISESHKARTKEQVEESNKLREETCLDIYGVPFYFQTDDSLQKSKQTKLKRYKDENYHNVEQAVITGKERDSYRKAQLAIPSERRKEICDKGFSTKKKNGTSNSSSDEEKLYESLVEIYSEEDVLRNYKCDRYPFHCDFYIPSEDSFIELNAHWTHGPEPYDSENEEHQKLLEKWKEKAKTSSFYQTAIYVWTVRDPLKAKTAKENNLNYKVIY